MRFALRTLLVATAAALAAVILPAAAGHGGGARPAGALVSDAAPGYAVEDYAYPQADKILQERGITLKRGDGHIVLADCAGEPGLLEIWARAQDRICFRVTGDTGFLTMEIPSVYGVLGNDYAATVDMTAGDEEQSFAVEKNQWTPVGETADPDARPFTLLEITTHR